ncbi:coiled-coil domain-containing protein [Endozoicomonas numazuensis]|uniref:Uncharacterized protein n=1 Tax=Endozoicomonas numazuensis TaxID=1137799 RepID=A0A081N3Y3_9GAMM|nr:hypothetical protein [Endozoicomonas numazuensis]KEQ13156.1 hypothetical protein GZ78_26805 [Endozoicomonas numazuensis]
MSVINRIEIASLLNKHGDVSSPWDAKMRHLLLNLRGQSTAMNMENGFGKTTLSDALIGMLSRDRSLIRKTRRKMSPSRDGRPWTHIRVEFSYSSGHVGQSDMLAAAGDSVGGTEQWVFGMYGHSDTDVGFYFFHGRLEQLPVSGITADSKLQLFSNDHFQHSFKQLKPERPKDRESWLEAISLHISRKELEQLASFQKEGGADKSQIFNAIKPRPGEKADQAFFYEVLAPQVLAGASQGETDESEEFIEDLVINSGRNVSELRHKINEKTLDLQRNRNKAERLAELDRSGGKLAETRSLRDRARKQLETQAICLATISDKGLPGIPASHDEQETVSQLAGEMAIRPGEVEPLVPLSALAKITGSGARKVEEYLESRQLSGYRHDRTAVVYSPKASWAGGKSMRLYPVGKTIRFLKDSQQLFKDDADRVNSLETLEEAVDHFLDLDTNPFRESYLADQEYLKTLKVECQELKESQRKLESEHEVLVNRDKEFTDNETVYTDALKEGLFTEQELDAPDETEASVKIRLKAVKGSYEQFLETQGRFKGLVDRWKTFQRDYGHEAVPDELIQEKDLQREELSHQLVELESHKDKYQGQERELNSQLQVIGQKLPGLESEFQRLDKLSNSFNDVQTLFPGEDISGLISRLEHQQRQFRDSQSQYTQQRAHAKSQLQTLLGLQPQYNAFLEQYPGQQPEGLEEALWQEKTELDAAISQQEIRVGKLQILASDLQQFEQDFPGVIASQWLLKATQAYPRLLTQHEEIQSRILDIERQLEDLKTNPISPSAAEVQCARVLNEQSMAHQPLHEVIAELLKGDDERKSEWLAQAHNLLFAPVLNSLEEARQAAELFTQNRQPVPVFTRDSLHKVVAENGSLLGAVIGYESLAVRALLNPKLIEELKLQLKAKLEGFQAERVDVHEGLELYHPESDSVRLAKSAVEAVEAQAEKELPLQRMALEKMGSRLGVLLEQLAPDNRKLIRSAEQFLELGGNAQVEVLKDSLNHLQSKLDMLTQQLSELESQLSGENRRKLDQAEQFLIDGGKARLDELKAEIELQTIKQQQLSEALVNCQETLDSYQRQITERKAQLDNVYQPGEADLLASLDKYLQDGGPEFMDRAEATQTSLENQLEQAQACASLKFDRIRAYLNARSDEGGTAALKKQIADLKSHINRARDVQDDKNAEIGRIQDEQPQQLKAIHQIDETAERWLKQLSHFSESMLAELPAPDLEQLEEMALFEKAEQYQEACRLDVMERDQICHCSLALGEQLELENIKELSSELKRQEKAHSEHEEGFRDVLGRIKNSERQLFNATEQTRLTGLNEAGESALKELASMISTLDEQIDHSTRILDELQESMNGYEDKLHERLSSIIMHSVDNLKILKRVAQHSTGDNAYFVIQADIVSEEGIRNLVRSLLAEIEDNQRQIRTRKAQNLPVGSEEKQRKELSQNLRSQIYRQLFTHISIRLKHDAIRPHGNLFSLNEDMSEGQREAVSLMWLVKLSEFAIERELKSVPSQYRRQERKSSESVIILDGLFSKLSHKKLIEDSLESLRNTRGRFQMVGLIHNPNYENDSGIFPTYLVGNVIGGIQGQGGHVTVKEGVRVSPASVGRNTGETSLFHLHVDHEKA